MRKLSTLFTIGVVVIAGLFGYGFYSIYTLQQKVDVLAIQLDATNAGLASTTADLAHTVAALDKTTAGFSNALNVTEQSIQNVQSQVGNVSGTVSDLQKLSKTDPQLLAKYSKIYFLNENYVPERLVQIDQSYVYSNTRAEQIHALVWPHMQSMLDAAKNAGVPFYVKSAYRSFFEQQALKGTYTVTYGAGTANAFSADQGYSEHQLGTAADFVVSGHGGVLDGFDKTTAFQWMVANAYQYGFVLSYPKGNSYYVFEPWHWRYVGVKLATDLHNQNKNFYDLDQRTIDTYLLNIFD